MGYILFVMFCMGANCSVTQGGVFGVETSCRANGNEAMVDSAKNSDTLKAVGFYCMMKT